MNDLYYSIQQMNRNELLNANEPELIESYVEEKKGSDPLLSHIIITKVL